MPVNSSVYFGIAIVCALLVGACSRQEKPATSTPASATDTIAAMNQSLNEVVARSRMRDKTALYESEFDYLRQKFSFDDYWNFPQIKTFESDTTESMQVTSFVAYPPDSAVAKIDILFRGPRNIETVLKATWTLYHHQGRWIFPVVSKYDLQRDFDFIKRQADSAAAAEEAEGG